MERPPVTASVSLPPWIPGRYPLNVLSDDPLFAETDVGRSLAARPLGFIDIGARGGVHDLVAPLARSVAVLGFEPDRPACEELNAQMARERTWALGVCLPTALADKEGPATLHLCAAPTNHSLLPINREFVARYRMDKFAQTGSIDLQAERLDTVLARRPADEPAWGEFMKIDTQGTEYEILEGSRRTLAERTAALFVEVEFCEIYAGQKLFSDLERFLRDEGFAFFGFHSTHERSRKMLDKKRFIGRERLLHADAIFFKDPLERRQAEMSPRQRHVVFVSALFCGFFDFALELVEAGLAGADAAERKRLKILVEKLAGFPPELAAKTALALADEVRANPSNANLLVGRFVDARRAICNFEDVQDP
jgi:FkbM family methyltransferase